MHYITVRFTYSLTYSAYCADVCGGFVDRISSFQKKGDAANISLLFDTQQRSDEQGSFAGLGYHLTPPTNSPETAHGGYCAIVSCPVVSANSNGHNTLSQKKKCHPFYIYDTVVWHPIFPILGRNIHWGNLKPTMYTARHISFCVFVLDRVKTSNDFYNIYKYALSEIGWNLTDIRKIKRVTFFSETQCTWYRTTVHNLMWSWSQCSLYIVQWVVAHSLYFYFCSKLKLLHEHNFRHGKPYIVTWFTHPLLLTTKGVSQVWPCSVEVLFH